jgi:hypothetical protein
MDLLSLRAKLAGSFSVGFPLGVIFCQQRARKLVGPAATAVRRVVFMVSYGSGTE